MTSTGRSGAASPNVCVIGGGPAGIVVAAELAKAGFRITVLEAGGAAYDHTRIRNLPRSIVGHACGAQAAARGSSVGHPYFPLRMSRARGVGGSTGVLKSHGLRSRPLDPIDFDGRLGVDWPISYDEFSSHLDAAASYCGIPLPDSPKDPWEAKSFHLGAASQADLLAVGFRHGSRAAFRELGAAAASHSLQQWLVKTTAVGFEVDSTGHVTASHAKTDSGESRTIEADVFVLAAGGIDNARLLLTAEPLLEQMGSAAENVGRNFMEHYHYVAGHIAPRSESDREAITRFSNHGGGEEWWLTLTDRLVEGARTAFSLVPVYSASLEPGVSALSQLLRAVPYGPFDRDLLINEVRTVIDGASAIPGAVAQRLRPSVPRSHFAVTAMSEQSPSTDSRITLSNRTDRTGVRLPVLEWHIPKTDVDSMLRSIDVLGNALHTSGIGEFVPLRGCDHGGLTRITGGWHHMGTTRMSSEPEDGVVDQHLRVHGLANLYIAGSSVFPTGGFANPTLSLVALATRLGKHIAAILD